MSDRLRWYIVVNPERGLVPACLNWYESLDDYYPALCAVAFDSEEEAQRVIDGVYAFLGRLVSTLTTPGKTA